MPQGSAANAARDLDLHNAGVPSDKKASSDSSSEAKANAAKLAAPPGTWVVTPPATPPANEVAPVEDQATEADQIPALVKKPLAMSSQAPLFTPGACVSDVAAPTGCQWVQGPTPGAMKPVYRNTQYQSSMQGSANKQTQDMLGMLKRTAQQAYPCQSWNLCVAANASPISGVTEAELILHVPPAAPEEMVTTATLALHEALMAQAPSAEVYEYDAEDAWISFSYLKDINRCCWEYLTQGYCPRMRTCRWPHLKQASYIVRVKLSRNPGEVSVPEFAAVKEPAAMDHGAMCMPTSGMSWDGYDQGQFSVMQGTMSDYGGMNYGAGVEGYLNVDECAW
jgi:hypothetical protein